MTPEIQDKMNNLCFQMNELEQEFRNDPSEDAQFCMNVIGQAIASMNMRLGNQWGKKMKPVAYAQVDKQVESAYAE